MRKISHITASSLIAVCILTGCTGTMEDTPAATSSVAADSFGGADKISQADAIKIANKILDKEPDTRSISNPLPYCEYVLNENSTRASETTDTLAYVLNYPDNNGFAIVATTTKAYPILAFSQTGNFSFDNEIAKENFIDKIGTYIENESASPAVFDSAAQALSTIPLPTFEMSPRININLGQKSPWDKYVKLEHPGCPTGCVAVATAGIMTFCKWGVSYHDKDFNLFQMRGKIHMYQNPSTETRSLDDPSYTQEMAIDDMAKLMYFIGKDLNMNYQPDGSGADSRDVIPLLNSLGYNVTTGYETYSTLNVVNTLKKNNLVYMRGYCSAGGHAWISDGYNNITTSTGNTVNITYFIHCNWGWDGNSNGYFNGDVFQTSSYNFKPTNYFGVEINNKRF